MLRPHEINNLGRQLNRFKNLWAGWGSELPRYEGTIFKALPFSDVWPVPMKLRPPKGDFPLPGMTEMYFESIDKDGNRQRHIISRKQT